MRAANLARHKNKVHRGYQCPFCPVSMMDVFYYGPALLHRHIGERHHGKMVHRCNECNNVYALEVNYRRHVAILHKKQCEYEINGCQP